MKALQFRLVSLTLLLPLSLTPLAMAKSTEPGHDEEREIYERLNWFYGDRGLMRNQPVAGATKFRLLRNQAVLETQQRVAAQAATDSLLAMWTSIGPAPIGPSTGSGPATGRVTSLAIDPTNTNIMYLGGAAGGVWKTLNGGTSWTPIFDSVGTQAIGAVAIAPYNHDEIWVGTGDFNGDTTYGYHGMGVFRSTDAGSTWQDRTGSGATAMPGTQVSSVILHPTNPSIVIVGVSGIQSGDSVLEGGIFYSSDAGATWTQVHDRTSHEIVRDPTNANILYGARRGTSSPDFGVVKSTDGGQTWVDSAVGITATGSRSELAISPSNPQVIYHLGAHQGSARLYRSVDGAATWTLMNGNACDGQCGYNLGIKVALNDPNTIYTGSLVPYKSTNGGTTLSAISGYGQKLHPDEQVIVTHPTDPNTIFIGTDGGLWKTTNGGTTFINLNGNMSLTQFYDVAVHPTTDAIVLGGSQDNSNERYAGSLNWSYAGFNGDGMQNAINPVSTNIWYIGTYPQGNGRPDVKRTVTAPVGPWTRITNSITEAAPWVTPFILDPTQPNTIYVGAKNLWRSTDTGTTFTQLSTSFAGFCRTIAVAPSNNQVIYAGSGTSQVYRSTDYGANWDDVTGTLPGRAVVDLEVHPNDALHVYVAKPNYSTPGLWVSTTGGGGNSWTPITNGLPQVPVNAIEVVENPFRIYVGTDVGVFVSYSDSGPFIPDMNGMALGAVISDLHYNKNTNTLTAGTYGRGAWQKDATPSNSWNVTVGKGASWQTGYDARVNAYRVDGSAISGLDITPYTGSTHGVNTAGADLTGDSVAEVLTGQGPGPNYLPIGKGYTNSGAAVAGVDFSAYGGAGYGLNVHAGDIDADGFDEILTGPGEGAVYGPQVRGWNYDNSGTTPASMGKVNFYAYGTLKYGVNVAGATTDADANFDEILTGAGPGAVFGPHVRGWNFDGGSITTISKINFFAYSTLKYGVNVGRGEVDRDGFQEIITGAGPGNVFGSQVRAFNVDGGQATSIAKINFFGYGTGTFGINVTSDDLDGDAFDEIAVGQGPDATVGAVLKGFNFDGATITEITAMNKTVWPGINYGVSVGSGAFGY